MSPFIPNGNLTVTAAIDRVVELMQGGDLSRLLTEDERATLRNWREWFSQLTRPQPKLVTPVPRADGRGPPVPRTSGKKYPHVLVEAKPERPDMTQEVLRDLEEKEAFFNEQRPAAEAVLCQLIYAGRVPWEIITEDGTRIAAPKHLSGGNQWYEALRSNSVTWRPGILSVTGYPVIPRDALEAVFNPDGTVKEEPEPVTQAIKDVAEQDDNSIQTVAKKTETYERDKEIYTLHIETLAANSKEKEAQIFKLLKKNKPALFINRRTAKSSETISDSRIRHIIWKQRQLNLPGDAASPLRRPITA